MLLERMPELQGRATQFRVLYASNQKQGLPLRCQAHEDNTGSSSPCLGSELLSGRSAQSHAEEFQHDCRTRLCVGRGSPSCTALIDVACSCLHPLVNERRPVSLSKMGVNRPSLRCKHTKPGDFGVAVSRCFRWISARVWQLAMARRISANSEIIG